MAAVHCPHGSESQPGAPEWLEITDALLSALIATRFPFAGVLSGLIGTTRHITALCDADPVEYPVFALEDFANQLQLVIKVGQWIDARLWSTYCQCRARPTGCGASYDGTEAGGITLLQALGEHHYAGGGESPAVRQETIERSGSYSGVIVPVPSGTADGDLLVFLVGSTDGGGCTSAEGLVSLDGAANYGSSAQLFATVWHTGDPTTYTFASVLNNSSSAVCHRISGYGPDVAIAVSAATSGASSTPALPSIALDYDSQLTLAYMAASGAPYSRIDPAGYTQIAGGLPYAIHYEAWAATGLPAGPTGSLPCLEGDAAWWSALQVVVHGTPASQSDWISWESSEGVPYGYAVQTASGSLLDHYESGVVSPGWRVELRWSAAEGGTLLGDIIQWRVLDEDGIAAAELEYGYFPDAAAAVWPCAYRSPVQTGPVLPPGYEDPHPAPGSSPEDIADAILELERKLDSMGALLAWMAGVVSLITGPYAIVAGQAQESLTGNAFEVLTRAAEAMSNYVPAGAAEDLLAEGVTGDWDVPGSYIAYRVVLTAIPAWTGSRAADPPLYEVNSRVHQLGWGAWRLLGGQLDYRLLVWSDQVLWAPARVAQGLLLHLEPGIVATVYGVDPVYAPRAS